MSQVNNFDVVVIGNAGIDTNVYLPGNEIDFDNEANFTDNIDYVGQAGGFSARGFAQMGYKTAYIGYIGNDHNGDFLKQEFEKDGINTDAVFVDPAGTSRSINLVYKNGQRKNFYDGKSHMDLEPDIDVCKPILKNSKVVHFNIPNWARELLPVAKKLGLIISTDLQDIVKIEDDYRQDFIKYSDVLFFSNTNFSTPEPIINNILDNYNKKIIVIGMGEKGCALATKDILKYFDALELDQPVIDTNGAGDGLAVGFLSAYYMEDQDLHESVKIAQLVARYNCTQKASTSNLITPEKLDKLKNQI